MDSRLSPERTDSAPSLQMAADLDRLVSARAFLDSSIGIPYHFGRSAQMAAERQNSVRSEIRGPSARGHLGAHGRLAYTVILRIISSTPSIPVQLKPSDFTNFYNKFKKNLR